MEIRKRAKKKKLSYDVCGAVQKRNTDNSTEFKNTEQLNKNYSVVNVKNANSIGKI